MLFLTINTSNLFQEFKYYLKKKKKKKKKDKEF